MGRRIIECVPNFSEGRDRAKVDAIAEVIARGSGVAVLGQTMDGDHNRSVITFAGSPEAVAEAALRAVAKAAELIDLNHHTGVHPRIGATDVLPFVPVDGVTLEDCARLAMAVGEEIWKRSGIPVYLYEAAAQRPERQRLENIRRGEFEGLRVASASDPDRRPDIGGPALHPTAGATVVGARLFLIAYNVNIASDDLSAAKEIARFVRASSGGFPHVKALGLRLEERNQVQVSMNLTDFRVTPLHAVYDAVKNRADALGLAISGSEIIGLIPKAAVERAAEHYLKIENFSPDLVLENKLAETLPFTVDDVLDDISDPSRATGGGAAAALAGAMSASLGVLVSRLLKQDATLYADHRQFFRAAADRDARAFAAVMRTSEPSEEDVLEAIEAPLAIAERAALLSSHLQAVAHECPSRYLSDAIAAIGLSAAAKAGAIATVDANLAQLQNEAARDSMAQRLRTIK